MRHDDDVLERRRLERENVQLRRAIRELIDDDSLYGVDPEDGEQDDNNAPTEEGAAA